MINYDYNGVPHHNDYLMIIVDCGYMGHFIHKHCVIWEILGRNCFYQHYKS